MPAEELRVIDRTGVEDFEGREWERRRARQESSEMAGRFRRGQLVRHPSFGVGRIAEVSDFGQQTRAVVEFKTAGRKTLILQYARLEPVG